MELYSNCERCGKKMDQMSDILAYPKVMLCIIPESVGTKSINLCMDCRKGLIEWLKGEKK